MKCPRCGSRDIRILAEIVCNVISDAPQNASRVELELVEGCDPHFNDDSLTMCNDCDHEADAPAFSAS